MCLRSFVSAKLSWEYVRSTNGCFKRVWCTSRLPLLENWKQRANIELRLKSNVNRCKNKPQHIKHTVPLQATRICSILTIITNSFEHFAKNGVIKPSLSHKTRNRKEFHRSSFPHPCYVLANNLSTSKFNIYMCVCVLCRMLFSSGIRRRHVLHLCAIEL